MTVMQAKTSLLLESVSRAAERARRGDVWAQALDGHRLLRTLDEGELSGMVASGAWLSFADGEVLSRQGDVVDSVMFVADGSAKAEIAAPQRGAYRAVVNFVGPGDDVGLLSLLDGAPHSATVTAMKPMRVLDVPVGRVEQLLRSHPEWYRELAEVAVGRLRTSTLWLQALI